MKHTLTIASGILMSALALHVAPAFAYVPPDAAFLEISDSETATAQGETVQDPVTRREAEQRAAQQQAQVIANNKAASANRETTLPSSASSAAAVTQSTSSTPQPCILGSVDYDECMYNFRMARKEDAKQGTQVVVITPDGQVMVDGTTYHSGAPIVSSTGPEMIVAQSAVALSGLLTLAYASRKRKALSR